MNAGNLNKRILVKNKVSSSMDIDGQDVPVYVTQSLWAKVNIVGGQERSTEQVEVYPEMCEFIIRRNRSIDENSVIEFNSGSYNVRYVQDLYNKNNFQNIRAERTRF